MEGFVKSVIVDRGFFFIRPDDKSLPDLFAHVRSLDRSIAFDETLRELRVAFETEESERGLRAVNVRCASYDAGSESRQRQNARRDRRRDEDVIWSDR